MNSLIASDNIWALWAIILGWAAISVWLDQTYKWASKLSVPILALCGAMVLSNLNIIPQESVVYDTVWDYMVPLTVPLLLFSANLKNIFKQCGKLCGLFLISSVGTMLGAVLAHAVLGKVVPESVAVATTMTGSYTGGVQNFAAMATMSKLSGEMTSALVVADNLLMVVLTIFLLALPSFKIVRKLFKHPYVDKVEAMENAGDGDLTGSAAFWKKKDICLKDMCFSIASAMAIVAVSVKIAQVLGSVIPTSNTAGQIANLVLSNQYLVLTTITIILTTLLPNFFGNLNGAQEIGMVFMYTFLVVIGVPASIPAIIQKAPILLVYTTIMVVVNFLITAVFGKLLGFSIEEISLASNANIGGPNTALSFVIAKNWTDLIVPAMLTGILGFVVGNYCGAIVYMILG